MLSLNDIINISFRKASFSGYKTEDVDEFIDEVKNSYELLIRKNMQQKEALEKLEIEKKALVAKTEDLNSRIAQYQINEEEIKNALVSAQKLSEASIKEAKIKCDTIIQEASLRAATIVEEANADAKLAREEMERLKMQVSDFKSNVLNLYKEHIMLINKIPSNTSTISSDTKISIDETRFSKEIEDISSNSEENTKTPSVSDFVNTSAEKEHHTSEYIFNEKPKVPSFEIENDSTTDDEYSFDFAINLDNDIKKDSLIEENNNHKQIFSIAEDDDEDIITPVTTEEIEQKAINDKDKLRQTLNFTTPFVQEEN